MVLFRSLALHADFDEMSCTPAPVGPTWPAQIRYVQTTRIGRFNFIFHRNLERWFEPYLEKLTTVPTSAQNRNFRFLESERAETDCERVGQKRSQLHKNFRLSRFARLDSLCGVTAEVTQNRVVAIVSS